MRGNAVVLAGALALAGCASPGAPIPFRDVTPAFASGSVPLLGPQVNVPYKVGKQPGAIIVPAQIEVPAGDSVRLTAGSRPQAGMPTVPLVPAVTTQFVYTAVYFTHETRLAHGLALRFELPHDVDPTVGTYYLVEYSRKTKSWDTRYATPLHSTSREIVMSPASARAVTYRANTAIGIALYRISALPP